MEKTLGGDRLGAGKKQKVELHNYERSTHDLGYIWRSTMSAGTLVPFMSEVALPGDTFDISLDCDVKTHPTIGPLFGSYKVQIDIFQAPIRLYQGQLHNNKLGIGLKMNTVKLPVIKLYAPPTTVTGNIDISNAQINPSSLLSYLNIRGIGIHNIADDVKERTFNAIPLLAYWEIYKNYYANKQEEIGYQVLIENEPIEENTTSLTIDTTTIPQNSGTETITFSTSKEITLVTTALQKPWQIIINTDKGDYPLDQLAYIVDETTTLAHYQTKPEITGTITVNYWRYITINEIPTKPLQLKQFSLATIDNMREKILAAATTATAFDVNSHAQVASPYDNILNWNGASPYMTSQAGLGIKTYNSDLFNNWLSTEWIDGANGINAITAIDTSSGSFTIDTLNLSKKVYDMLNRIAVSGGSYDDWLDAVWVHDRIVRAESPIYHGGLIKELIFQEVISNSESEEQPLGTLAGRGRLSDKHKGGRISIRIDEPSYIIGIVSLTPRIDYSQGNKWDTHLQTMDDFHKPQLDQIGFQELITEQMVWFGTRWNETTGKWETTSAGKQPAWINYMTNVNQVRGNFAIKDNEMFMTLNRNYEQQDGYPTDITTYIDPVKYNQIFAETAIDAQNFWTQIAVDITARRKMSAKIMPNL